jgi:putative chitinase
MIIDWNNPRAKVSQFFTVQEVTQGDRRRIPQRGSVVEANVIKLATQLDIIRVKWGKPIGVTSWYRPPLVNAEVGGVTNSQHILGTAVDVYDYSGDDIRFENFLDLAWGDRALGYGVASGRGFTHLDLRTGRIRWNY